MPTTFHLRVWTRFFEPVERVWAVKTDARALKAEFPPWLPFTVSDEAALRRGFEAGEPCTVDGRLGLVLPWPVHLERVEPGRLFKDTSQNAVYSRFEHEHLFEETSDGCRYIDAVTFTPRLPASKLVAIQTERLFIRRHRAAARLLRADPRTVGVSVLRVHDDAVHDDAVHDDAVHDQTPIPEGEAPRGGQEDR